jgi:DNA-directed RNA polymerase specialized sigma24 family protein
VQAVVTERISPIGRLDADGFISLVRARCRAFAAASTWLYRIVYNACVDDLRQSGSRREVSLDEWSRTNRQRFSPPPSRFSVPHIWAIDGPLVITIAGNVDGDELVRIAESLAR